MRLIQLPRLDKNYFLDKWTWAGQGRQKFPKCEYINLDRSFCTFIIIITGLTINYAKLWKLTVVK